MNHDPILRTVLRFPDHSTIPADVLDYFEDQVLCRYSLPRGLVTLAWLPQEFLQSAK